MFPLLRQPSTSKNPLHLQNPDMRRQFVLDFSKNICLPSNACRFFDCKTGNPLATPKHSRLYVLYSSGSCLVEGYSIPHENFGYDCNYCSCSYSRRYVNRKSRKVERHDIGRRKLKHPKQEKSAHSCGAIPTISILRKFSECLFNAPAMYPISMALRTQPNRVGPKLIPPPPRKDPVYSPYLTAYHIDQTLPIRKPEAPPAHRFQTNPSNNGTATVITSSSISLMMPMIIPEEPLIPPASH